jgi:hypothetical protein
MRDFLITKIVKYELIVSADSAEEAELFSETYNTENCWDIVDEELVQVLEKDEDLEDVYHED